MLGVASAPGGAGANSADTLARRALPTIAHGARPPSLLAAAHARIYLSTGTSWSLQHEGVAALVGSYARPGTDLAIHLFDGTRGHVWTQRLYRGFEYKQDRALFHSFEGDDAVVGVAFANKAEALAFAHAVLALPLEEEVQEKPKWGAPSMMMAAPVAVPVAINGFAVGGGGASDHTSRTSTLATRLGQEQEPRRPQ
ncbi:hypothetical protein AMAG_20633 [Allomyces macrogynus ATCC 38327]|uniref:WH1 domain-containing protein n=1 Tax=Allomyces macrogynus (strain ATCC 38327) TaxID=578462 RepID=A0A0L0TDD4_ALLM3|nr:hypothetical protein AMAG_20633 [Allomyces macrogynus ATCC 38327]|eukprot:KNE72913.1 hypothetical protein AMAG_20633 [Allomyces macrogynus ATCC 38327]